MTLATNTTWIHVAQSRAAPRGRRDASARLPGRTGYDRPTSAAESDPKAEHEENDQGQGGQVAEAAVEGFQGRPVAREPADVLAYPPPGDAAKDGPPHGGQAQHLGQARGDSDRAPGGDKPQHKGEAEVQDEPQREGFGVNAAVGRSDDEAASHLAPQDGEQDQQHEPHGAAAEGGEYDDEGRNHHPLGRRDARPPAPPDPARRAG